MGAAARLGALAAAAALAGPVPAHADGVIPRHGCAGPLVASAGLVWGTTETDWTTSGGPARNVMLSATPTARGRAAPLRLEARMWRELRRCAPLPAGVTRSARRSLRMQLLCHAYWSRLPVVRAGGATWELEAWRPPVSRAAVLSPAQVIDPGRRCNWGPDTGPPM